ncbi:Elongator protein 3/MiaB/NifB OS=Tsukamurella paurometabola (strain ATCC 8368 / DSM / CCUG 35730/ CIP 100753 / JCM 10117 / KCTC 9821 / NBRC 16120 / NCIMB 702349 / NCTC 13040) OX=521096 GN=Tpau_1176 PE=4 SV=1 [Tsukamurella paurometabola]|uniref:Elongator protein 3/MiaB/NifB n=1 Tax=Tsukamurella paurometabola (strain ATCC 8368 / DSM 20162 / CCUG 35730 / CIP 100753 / JCM 10117 / KCTC 9821 / NBRC 16120 / NCIMB 702349 / NCTC 13040) TaxID=521096 RepID=D5UW00_TSUPD|nr:cobalamin-dependent protein [Tsukamurella paurometabola]ADG77807.1 Elongator protein 3/MiaB/NifB [Tsukamurella paurometabola DSM 20162]SUP28830.1 bacteriocin maturation radical SAM protein 1 [Tsukamurella paurometabola]
MDQKLVIVVSPPNSNTVLDGAACTVTSPIEHTDWSDFPNLGALTLASAIEEVPGVEAVYLDGTVVDWSVIADFVVDHADRTLALCVSALTATYEAGLCLARKVKSANSDVVTIFGNDYLTALPRECMDAQTDVIDFAFFGNEVIGAFTEFICALSSGTSIEPERFPSLIYRDSAEVVSINKARPEGIYTDINFDLVDRHFDHTSLYADNFERRVVPTFERLTGRRVRSGTPVEFARGCIKFARNDACSFCSIQYGGLWRNSVESAAEAWKTVEHADEHGYDYLYLTADELPLTFGRLLGDMANEPPLWWRHRDEGDRPVMVGYARADGLSNERNAANLRALNVRQLMVGLDAGTALSLQAMRKPLAPPSDRTSCYRAEEMFKHNERAMRTAKNNDLVLKVGFVVGHIGMDSSMLRENVDSMKALLESGADSIASLDVEVLSPEPGSRDYQYLINPDLAFAAAEEIGMVLPDRGAHKRVAMKWRGHDTIDREAAMSDYIDAVMPGLAMDDLAAARREVRNHAELLGITTGG